MFNQKCSLQIGAVDMFRFYGTMDMYNKMQVLVLLRSAITPRVYGMYIGYMHGPTYICMELSKHSPAGQGPFEH